MLESAPAGEPPANIDARDLPCAQDSPDLADATAWLDALDRQIRSLKPKPGDSHTAANEALIALSRHRCMLLSRVGADELRAEAAPALIDFWDNDGKFWIESQLNMARGRRLQYPPPMRKVMAIETRPGHPATSLLCSLSDPTCGKETTGWWQRAEASFRLKAAPIPRINRTQGPFAQVPLTEKDCRDEAIALPAAERYATWQRCAGELRSYGFAMPLGRVRAPTSGWLVVRGRRGHYSYCDEVRMYSLATGATYISQSCSLLMLLIAGDGTPARNRQVVRGSVPVDNIREVAWMLLQVEESIEDFTGRNYFTVPAGIEPMDGPDNPFLSGRPRTSRWASSDQTTLAWALTDATGEHLVSGKATWPGNRDGGPNDYAIELLQIAEAGFMPGCPAEKPPEDIGLGESRPAVSPLDANPVELSRVERDLMTDLHQAARADCQVQR